MKNLAVALEHDRTISVVLPVGQPEVMAVGNQLQAIREEAYMNGYNWAALLSHYLTLHHPDLIRGQDSDPEADTYVVYYPASPANKQQADRLAALLNELLQNPGLLYDFVRAEGDNIEWD